MCCSSSPRSTTCVVVYLMLKHDWGAVEALKYIRQTRPVQVSRATLQILTCTVCCVTVHEGERWVPAAAG